MLFPALSGCRHVFTSTGARTLINWYVLGHFWGTHGLRSALVFQFLKVIVPNGSQTPALGGVLSSLVCALVVDVPCVPLMFKFLSCYWQLRFWIWNELNKFDQCRKKKLNEFYKTCSLNYRWKGSKEERCSESQGWCLFCPLLSICFINTKKYR